MVAQGPRQWRRPIIVAVALYAVVLAAGELGHHDLACHLKTPQHCSSCTASPLSSSPHSPARVDRSELTDAGRAEATYVALESAVLPAQTSGRSPPTLG